MGQTRPLGAQISHMLKDRGVDVIFGIPGVHNQEMYRGIEEAGITHVLARHEQGAGFMADGYARATGRPGVAYVITGPGVCNILTPMGQAYSDSVPMLVIASCLEEVSARRGQLHQMKDQEGAANTVCDWSETAQSADAAYKLVDRALMEFATDRARPKYIQVPIGVLEAKAEAAATPALLSYPPEFPPPNIDRIASLVLASRRPLFIFGGGAVPAWADARRVVTRLGAASMTTYAGRGIIPAEDPFFLGSYLARPDSATLIAQADLVVAVGTELAEVDLWRAELGHTSPLVRVDIDPEVLSDPQGAEHPLHMDAVVFLAALADAMESEEITHRGWDTRQVADCKRRWRNEVATEYPGIPKICETLRDCLPTDTMIYSDMTQFAYAAKEVWDMDRPGHWHHPYGFGTLGYALPAAIGGAIGRPGLPTMAIVGDYGFHYTMQELGVAVELELPLPIILWDNGKLGAIEASMVQAQIAPNAVKARNPDFCRLAEAFGAHAEAPQTLSALHEAVQAAFEAQGPTLIYVTPDIISQSPVEAEKAGQL